ncbi:hypothetical protein CWATWH0402_2721 [Crocosphaera watsonii WH 0402]|uniref:Uncharacterized protein n=1 Tax=Crocosphaera watsonii WH 0402 TaxID=1284629 RepID=T2JTW3_CROWT|nr:hypothetical protein CWATWH0402_2721 [Crocosphaera watsonii WH 0402]
MQCVMIISLERARIVATKSDTFKLLGVPSKSVTGSGLSGKSAIFSQSKFSLKHISLKI